MGTALNLLHRMTVAEFESWNPPAGLEDSRWELVDGEPVCMAPPTDDHGAIQSHVAYLITGWLLQHRPECRVITTPGVIPHVKRGTNTRVPDLGITCGPRRSGTARSAHVILIEILSPSNEARTRANVWAYTTIPSVQEILVLSSTSIQAELLRRQDDGHWPEEPVIIEAGQDLHLASIGGYQTPLRSLYQTTSFATPGG